MKNSSVRLPLDPPRRLLRSRRRHPFLCIVRSQEGSPPFPPAVKQDPSRNPPSPVSTAGRIQPGRQSRRGADLLRVTKFSLLMEIFLGGSKYYFFTWEAMLLFLRGLPQGGGAKKEGFSRPGKQLGVHFCDKSRVSALNFPRHPGGRFIQGFLSHL